MIVKLTSLAIYLYVIVDVVSFTSLTVFRHNYKSLHTLDAYRKFRDSGESDEYSEPRSSHLQNLVYNQLIVLVESIECVSAAVYLRSEFLEDDTLQLYSEYSLPSPRQTPSNHDFDFDSGEVVREETENIPIEDLTHVTIGESNNYIGMLSILRKKDGSSSINLDKEYIIISSTLHCIQSMIAIERYI